MTASEELGIIKKILAGEKDAFEELVIENETKVYNLALKMLGNETEAQDIAQEAFIKAYTRLDKFRGDSRFSVWLYRVTYNLCIDYIRKESNTQKIPLTYEDEDRGTIEVEIPDTRPDPESAILNHETRTVINAGLAKLNPKHREILMLREICGMSYNELSETLNINEGTVKSRIARARKTLADYIRGREDGTLSAKKRLKGEREVGDSE